MLICRNDVAEPSHASARLADLKTSIEHLADLLPAQGPITVFIHHNTLHAFEDDPFARAVIKGHKLFHAHPYLPEQDYRRALESGRIRREDVAQVLLDDLGDDADQLVGLFGTRYYIRLSMIQHPLHIAPDAELRWFIEETDALKHIRRDTPADVRERVVRETRHWVMRDLREESGDGETLHRPRVALQNIVNRFGRTSIDRWDDATWESFYLHALWRVCHQGVHGVPHGPHHETHAAARPRDALLAATGADADLWVNDLLIPFCAAFLDQGLALWSMPRRDEGFFQCFASFVMQGSSAPTRWLETVRREFSRIEGHGVTPLASIEDSLRQLGIDRAHRESFLAASLIALRGWAGMIWQLETRGDRASRPVSPGTLIEFLAARLILDRLALATLAEQELDYRGPLDRLHEVIKVQHHPAWPSVDQRAFVIFQIAQVLGWTPATLFSLSKCQWQALVGEIESFSALERRRVYHLAFERRYRMQALDAIARRSMEPLKPFRPAAQLITCLDDREESFRRHVEEIDPSIETFGAAGFFAVPMYYRGAADAHFVPLCPIVIRPKHYMTEHVPADLERDHQRRGRIRRLLGQASHRVHSNSRGFVAGALLAGLLGPLASFPMVLRVLFPRFTGQLRRRVGRWVQPPPKTMITLDRQCPEPGPGPDEMGFTVPEMADAVQRQLEDIGLVRGMARLIIVCGHGSGSLNNPHESAYNCGACGGNRGGPNARTFALMANDPRVRGVLLRRGFVIPEETVFVGAFHNTCDESVVFADLDRIPASHRPEIERVRRVIDQSRARNAHEKSRRFASASLDQSAEEALRHVEARSEDLSQVRPEYNHATNAVCFVGRRLRTRGLFMDRRCFLASYDASSDEPGAPVLTRILQAAVPVCSGINLEYYFSTVDPVGWGCGTKLPHNITSLIGVMEGAASDLRPGLSAQMTEIHEPIRLLFVIENTPEVLQSILAAQPAIRRLCENEWVQLATLDPHSPAIHVFRQGRFEPHDPESLELPVVPRSVDWYRGWRDHLGFCLIDPEKAASSAVPLFSAKG